MLSWVVYCKLISECGCLEDWGRPAPLSLPEDRHARWWWGLVDRDLVGTSPTHWAPPGAPCSASELGLVPGLVESLLLFAYIDVFYQDGFFSSDDELDEGVVDVSDEDVDDVFLIVRSRLPFGLIPDEWGADWKVRRVLALHGAAFAMRGAVVSASVYVASDVGFRCVKVVKARTKLNEWWMWTSGSSISSWRSSRSMVMRSRWSWSCSWRRVSW